MTGQRDVRVRRAYEKPSDDDGRRILVDRLWPRGLSKAAAGIDEWMKSVAPSPELRHWYGHDPAKFDEFKRRYLDELREPEQAGAFARLCEEASEGTITLITASKAAEISDAAVLAKQLRSGAACPPGDQADTDEDDPPGDPPCLQRRVCERCGGVADSDPPTTCPHCGADMPGDLRPDRAIASVSQRGTASLVTSTPACPLPRGMVARAS